MDDRPAQWTRDHFRVSTDRATLDIDAVLALLRTTFWGTRIPRDDLAQSIDHSLTFALYDGDTLVGLTRVITDRTTFGYLTDVVVAETHRNRGLGQWLLECVLAHPDLRGLRRIALLTRDARTLYARCGFTLGPPGDQVYMEKRSETGGESGP